ncbi:hypothetical protein [Clostridium kluyveri]|uniref:Uncharacterized protein n=2 Tax=Clostridium kluyveri TaxID=1534 RepID=A5N8N9_CLOK5|nr:hypothetical protein [Clostridium kluyveri]EDK33670.1 Conserved hypothetical protein [Clostridium kluyveri DSM 555]BAH06564.1 hypothetical protein CKR_1513 [Clostridium kluyveri NBRC 12016]
MKFESKRVSKKSSKFSSWTAFYIAALVTLLVGIALLVNDIILFRKTVNQYVAQGYSANVVLGQLVPSQLLPGIFQFIGLYGGIVCILIGIGIINKKLSKIFGESYNCDDNSQENIKEQEVIDVNEIEDVEGEKDTEVEKQDEDKEADKQDENKDIGETNKEQ